MTPRRPRKSLNDPVQVGWLFERAEKERMHDYARRYGVTASAFMQLVAEHVVLDDDGTVRMTPIAPLSREEGLPIDNG